MESRRLKIQKIRRKQPSLELKRKAGKACRHKGRMWTTEEIDYIHSADLDPEWGNFFSSAR